MAGIVGWRWLDQMPRGSLLREAPLCGATKLPRPQAGSFTSIYLDCHGTLRAPRDDKQIKASHRNAVEHKASRDVTAGVSVRCLDLFVIARDRKSTRLNSSHQIISYAVFCLKKKK